MLASPNHDNDVDRGIEVTGGRQHLEPSAPGRRRSVMTMPNCLDARVTAVMAALPSLAVGTSYLGRGKLRKQFPGLDFVIYNEHLDLRQVQWGYLSC